MSVCETEYGKLILKFSEYSFFKETLNRNIKVNTMKSKNALVERLWISLIGYVC